MACVWEGSEVRKAAERSLSVEDSEGRNAKISLSVEGSLGNIAEVSFSVERQERKECKI